MKKQRLILILSAALAAVSLTSCGAPGGGRYRDSKDSMVQRTAPSQHNYSNYEDNDTNLNFSLNIGIENEMVFAQENNLRHMRAVPPDCQVRVVRGCHVVYSPRGQCLGFVSGNSGGGRQSCGTRQNYGTNSGCSSNHNSGPYRVPLCPHGMSANSCNSCNSGGNGWNQSQRPRRGYYGSVGNPVMSSDVGFYDGGGAAGAPMRTRQRQPYPY